ncbi:MAG: FAD-binding protein [Vicinamibacterales bacterium]|nr:FAD-binding protein [Vicinamibacterales bacterium]
MTSQSVRIDGNDITVISVNTLVVGSGAAALNAAASLHDRGVHDVALVTEAWGGGTSANAGSDKQTYYKLSLAGHVPDSPRLLAEDLFAGGSMHGDIALCEAQQSAQAFYHLVQAGVAFPHDRYGGFTGYQTDHDQRGRATSAGPLTSHLMVKALSRVIRDQQVPIFEPCQVVALLTDDDGPSPRVAGALALDLASCTAGTPRFMAFNAVNVILGTGGPGGLYLDSVYPPEQTGSIGIALRAGAIAQNLTESQFGLASIGFRWNVSGSYQQVIPRYVSTDASGRNEHEFLNDAFADAGALGTAIFRKGYQWPFDPRRVRAGGSSLIDLLVHRERVTRRRRVFLDFTRNFTPRTGAPFSLAAMHDEARTYLEQCGATGPTPIARLAVMNQPAIDLYRAHDIDLARDRLEIAVCAQHNNGGLRGNIWWESNVTGLFPVGEVNGSHGVRRPGGASLNAGQVGGQRVATFIAARRNGQPPPLDTFHACCGAAIAQTLEGARRALDTLSTARLSPDAVRLDIQQRMSRAAGHVRTLHIARVASQEAWDREADLEKVEWAPEPAALPAVFRNRDLCLAHAVYLDAIVEHLERGGQSRGSYIIVNPEAEPALEGPDPLCRFAVEPPGSFVDQHILEIACARNGGTKRRWTPIRPIPDPDGWFESVWRSFREGATVSDDTSSEGGAW